MLDQLFPFYLQTVSNLCQHPRPIECHHDEVQGLTDMAADAVCRRCSVPQEPRQGRLTVSIPVQTRISRCALGMLEQDWDG